MINLLPDERKRDITAGRTNVILLRYNLLALVSFVGLAGICAMFAMMLQQNYDSAVRASVENSTKVTRYEDIRIQAEDYRKNLTLAGSILNNSFNYTPVIFSIAKLLPNGVILDGITLNTSNFGQQTTFTAHAKTIALATSLKENFQKSTMFTNVYFQSVTDNSANVGDDDTANAAYPIAITISAKINKEKVGN